MPYSEIDKHCNECICALCEYRGTDDCIEGPEACDKCKNDGHYEDCWWLWD